MNSRVARTLVPRLSPNGLMVLVIVLAFSFVAIVLIPGLELASGLADTSVALKFSGQQQRNPAVIRASLESMHDRLTNRGYIQESLDQLRDASSRLDSGLRVLNTPRASGWLAFLGDKGEPISGKHGNSLKELWAQQVEALQPILKFTGVPYQDNETTGTVLNDAGKQLERDVTTALRVARRNTAQLDAELSAIVSELQASNARSATQLRFVMLTGLLIAIVLGSIVTVLVLARKRQDASLREARQQTTDILRTVKDGLFLLDENLVIGSSYSSALETLFQRNDFAGLSFEQLLKNVVSEKTLATALKFVGVLWSERTKENLVKTINPLGEVEVNVDAGHGKTESRYLQFEFHRVRVDGKISSVLVAVSDVSARVDLARELQASQNQAQAQVDTLLGILHVDPTQLAAFLNDSNAAMKMINAVLREPAREESAFRRKLDTLFRQVHSVKGEAAALGLSSIESRAHSFEDDLKALREKADLSGNDFLPLVIKLDDLLTHLQSVGDLVSRLARLHVAATSPSESHTDTAVLAHGTIDIPPKTESVATMLQQLTQRVAEENDREASLQCVGFDIVPDEYRRIVKDISVQAVRNAVVHGIEPSSERLNAGKTAQGNLKLIFQDLGDAGYKLIAEDDGQGLSTEKIKEAALRKGFITPEKALTLDAKQTFSLLFQPGFSTVETASKDAGRGVGMNLMAGLMQQIGGKVSVATLRGKFTRLTMSLPPAKRDTTEAA